MKQKENREHINEISCAYTEIMDDCFYNFLKNDFWSSKNLSETTSKSCKKLNQSLVEQVMNKAG